jgi:hypothetical protein
MQKTKKSLLAIAKILVNWLQLVIIVLLLANTLLFQHRHVLADGTVIVHAHPFKKNTKGEPVDHKHSSDQFLRLSVLYHGGLLPGEQCIPDVVDVEIANNLRPIGKKVITSKNLCTSTRQRGPPNELVFS